MVRTVTCVAALAAAACSEERPPTTWSEPVQLGAGRDTLVAVAADGSAVVTWQDGEVLRARVRDAAGSWSQAVTLEMMNAPDAGLGPVSAVAANAAGDFVVAWHTETVTVAEYEYTLGTIEVKTARFTADGGWSDAEVAFVLEEEPILAAWPHAVKVVLDDDGAATLVTAPIFSWGRGDIRVARQEPGGAWSAFESPTTNGFQAELARAPGGGGVGLVWREAAPSSSIRVTWHQPGGAWTAPATVPDTENVSGWEPKLAASDDGAWWLAYVDTQLTVRRYTIDGGWEAPSRLAAALGPSSMVAAGDGAMAAWVAGDERVAHVAVANGDSSWADTAIAESVSGLRLAASGDHAISLSATTVAPALSSRRFVDGAWADAQPVEWDGYASSRAIGISADGEAIAVWSRDEAVMVAVEPR